MRSGEINEVDELLKIMLETRREINMATSELFSSNHIRLAAEPLSYIVYAVWGIRNNGNLTSDQKAINENIESLITRLSASLKLDLLGPSQKYAIQYILRDLIIAKLIFMTEMLKETIKGVNEIDSPALQNLEPFGHA
ncbi:MAG: hypothetical protein ABFD62_15700 [Syntrophaceae bacterium]|jgi:hypothetical protein